jgi:hypothetical protein
MPARVHALLVVRVDGADDQAIGHLQRTLRAIRAGDRRPDALTLVVCGRVPSRVTELASAAGVEAVIEAPRGTGYAGAVRMASVRLGDADAVWLLAQDTAPDADALHLLAGSLEVQPSVAAAAPKLVAWDAPDAIVSLGVSMTRFGRSVGLVDGRLDQGQHDGAEDALGADVRGLLVRRAVWDLLGGIDPGLQGADEGLDLGIRSRLIGGRIALVPAARIAVAGDGVAGLPGPRDGRRGRHRDFMVRTAQLHRRLVYALPGLVPLIWLSILPLALARTILHLVRKSPGSVAGEWRASVLALARVGSVARARGRIRMAARATGIRVPWAQLAPLRVTRSELIRRFDDPDDTATEADVRTELRFFTGGGAWTVLAALVVGAVAFFPLLAWSSVEGGGLLPLPATVHGLWSDVVYGRRGLGLDVVGPADPFAAVIAILGSLTPWNPSLSLVLLWIVALPLAALGGWFAATRLTERSGLRIAAAILWALAPTFLTALMQGRPAAVLVHLLLPWLFYAGAMARRSWGSAGVASMLLAAVVACAPSLAPALAVLWLVALVTAGRGAARVAWLPVPALVMFAPLIWFRGVRGGDLWGLFADPGLVWAAPQAAADVAGRALLASGFPTPDFAGWTTWIAGDGAAVGAATPWWLVLPLAPLAVLALLSLGTPRWPLGGALVGVAVVGLASAFFAAGVVVQFAAGVPVAPWPGNALSLAWLGVVGAAVVTADTPLARPIGALRPWAVGIAVAGVVLLALPALSATIQDRAELRSGRSSTLPAFVDAVGRDDPDLGTLVLTPLGDGAVSARVVWGASETLSGQTTQLSAATRATESAEALASLSAELVSPSVVDVAADLASQGIGFVLLADGAGTEASDALTLQAVASLDARAGLESVGDTGRGKLWRLADDIEVAPRAPLDRADIAIQRLIALGQAAIILVALLLAFPTGASRRAARSRSRLVGMPATARAVAARAPRERPRRVRGSRAVAGEPTETPGPAEAPDATAATTRTEPTPSGREPNEREAAERESAGSSGEGDRESAAADDSPAGDAQDDGATDDGNAQHGEDRA